jgi:type IV pilus assembly protein PilV
MNQLNPSKSTMRHRAKGFTLTEVLVALIIIAIGTLGIAKMQALALSSTGASRSRALAALEASSLAAAMHANRAYWAGTPANVTVTTSVGSTGVNPPAFGSTGTLQTALTNALATAQWCPTSTTMPATLSCYCALANANSCSAHAVNMAANDLYDWGSGLASLLPTSTASVTCNTADAPVDCTITIQWTENAVSINQQEGTAASSNANTAQANTAAFQYVTYSLYVVP